MDKKNTLITIMLLSALILLSILIFGRDQIHGLATKVIANGNSSDAIVPKPKK